MSWAKPDKTLQETVAFTDKKKILFSRIEELYFSKEVK